MSLQLLNAAFQSGVKPSSMRFVLIAICNFANEDNEAYPSQGRISSDTGLDLKTVGKHILALERQGYLVDTKQRKGRTMSTKVWHVSLGRIISTPKNGVPPLLEVSIPKNGGTKLPQKRVIEPLVKNLKEPSPEFDAFWKAYDKKIDKQDTLNAWNRLSKKDRVAAFDGVATHVVINEKQYRKDPKRYIAKRQWENEVIGGEVPADDFMKGVK